LEITLSTIINRENAGIVPAFFMDLSQTLSEGEGLKHESLKEALSSTFHQGNAMSLLQQLLSQGVKLAYRIAGGDGLETDTRLIKNAK
jgi:hypothetical protein